MSWISDGRGDEELARKKSKGRLSANLYPGVGEESILRATANADVSSPNAPTVRREEHRRFGPLMVNSTPNVRSPAPVE